MRRPLTPRQAAQSKLRQCRLPRTKSRPIEFERLEDRQLLASVFTNSFNPYDVTNDGFVVAEDVVTVINYINAHGSGPLPDTNNSTQKFVDVDGDASVTATDVITIINAINSGNLPGLVALTERHSFSEQGMKTVNLPAIATGSRTIQFDLATRFDTGISGATPDQVLVYLVDPANPTHTLLDRGTSGTSIFSLIGSKADFPVGLVRYDGNTVTIDTSNLATTGSVGLKFQLISTNGVESSQIVAKSFTVSTDPDGSPPATIASNTQVLQPDAALNVTGFATTSDIDVSLGNIRFVPSDGTYTSELRATAKVDGLGRTVVVTFPGLPSGVTLDNASGTTPGGIPYINLHSAVPNGGLATGENSSPVELRFKNPNNIPFALKPQVLVGGANHAPVFSPVGDLSVMPGGVLRVPLQATDADGDPIYFSTSDLAGLPFGTLQTDNTLVFRPAPSQLGDYSFDIFASDGKLQTTQHLTLHVVADSITTTRVSGQILVTSGQPLANMQIEIGGVNGLTGSDGSFALDLGSGSVVSDTIKVRGDLYTGAASYPFIAEKLAFILDHDVYLHVNNVIDRPIYLPALDTANGKTIDPAHDTTVTTAAIPGASVFVKAGTLMNQQGTAFTGTLSITDVPRDLTPAALPDNLRPSQVVTIQPGDMVFTAPAPLSLPNTSSATADAYAPGTLMDLWSINPVTGQFDNVGTGQVSADGKVINTISGGIRNSSWHFFVPKPPTPTQPDNNSQNPNNDCFICWVASLFNSQDATSVVDTGSVSSEVNSQVEHHSGAVMEMHDLPTYNSLGLDRGVQLVYDSLRADPRPIVHATYADVDPNIYSVPSALRLTAQLSVQRGTFQYQVPGNAGGQNNLQGGENFWTIPSTRGAVDGALQVDMTDQPSGNYDYTLTSGILGYSAGANGYIGTMTPTTGHFLVVNTIASPFGSGWGLVGLQQIVENPDGSLLLIDGNGTEELFQPPPAAGTIYDSPTGDFSTMERLVDGTFRRTTTDQTVYNFNNDNNLASVRDRNGNTTTYTYDASGHLTLITDPVGLPTTFAYTGGLVSSITDPAGRTTQLGYDGEGNLTQATDPDGSKDQWQYDADHHLTSAIDKRGNVGQDFYDFSGRATKFVRPDGSVSQLAPVETQGLYTPDQTANPATAPAAYRATASIATFADANGNVTRTTLDARGQEVAAFDGVGPLPTTQRDLNTNLVTESTNARGSKTDYTYDSRGNVLTVRDTPTETAFTEVGGQVTVEAEHFTSRSSGQNKDWNVVPGEDPGVNPAVNFRGTGFLQVLPETNGFNGDPLGDTGPSVDYKLHINTPGAYQLYVRMASFDAGSDSMYARILELGDGPGGSILDYVQYTPYSGADFNANGWKGTAGYETTEGYPGEAPAIWNISTPGDYTIRFSMREDGMMLDAFDFQLASLPAPTGAGPPETIPDVGSGVAQKTFTYDAKFSQVTTMTDELGRQTLYNIDPANGNVLSITNVVGAVGGADDVVTQYTYTPQGLIDTMTDPLGHVTDYDYDALGRLISVTEAEGTLDQGLMHMEYDAAGNTTAIVDENNNRTTFTYDALNRVTRATEPDPDGAGQLSAPFTTFVYDAAGNATSQTDPRGNTTLYQYDSLNRLTTVTDAISGVRQLTYDPAGNLAATTDELGRKTTYRYDARNRLIDTVDAAGGHTRMQYDFDDNLRLLTDPDGHTTTYTYDARSRLISTIDALGHSTIDTYDLADELIGITDRNGHQTTFAYDDLGRQTTTTNPLGDATRLAYDKASNTLSSTDELGRVTQWTYDARNRVVTSTNPLGKTRDFSYDPVGNLLSLTDELNHTTQFKYDAINRVIETDDALAGVTTFVFDAADNLTSTTDQLSRTTAYQYDALNRQTKVTDPLGHATTMTYDAVGNLIATADPLNHVTQYAYDALDRLIRTTDPRGAVTTRAYDPAGNLTRLTDPDGNTTSYTYDQLNRQISDKNALNATESYQYDAVGNLTSLTDRDGRVRQFIYDALDRPTAEKWLAANSSTLRTINYSFDAASQMTGASDPDSTYAYTYDADSRLTSSTNANTPGAPTVAFAYTYDAADNRLGRSDTISGQAKGTTGYLYDVLNRMTRVTQSGNGITDKRVDFTYDAASQMTGVARFSDLAGAQSVAASAYVYDNAGRLTSLTHTHAASPIAQYAWTYDAANRVTQATLPDGTTNFTYDEADQLKSADNSFQTDENFTYDPNGNRTNTGYQTNPNNQLKSDGVFTYQYDAEGNRTSRTKIATGEVTTYTWDYRNRLTQVTTKSSTGTVLMQANYVYDAFDRRIAKTVDADGAGPGAAVTERFVYDGDQIALTFDGAGALTHRYLYGPAIDQILADENAQGQILWPLTDNQGTVRDLVNSSGVVQDHIKYDSFGQVTAESNSATDFLFGYTGRERDRETGLDYYRARYYDPATGRFTSEDPIGFLAGDPNLARYVFNNPLRYTDPSGLEVIVYVWNPDKGANSQWGHASMQVDGTYISWWPKLALNDRNELDFDSIFRTINLEDSPTRGRTFEQDKAGEKREPDYKIRINGLDEQKIKDWWKGFGQKEGELPTWDARVRNCSTVVAIGLSKGGADKVKPPFKPLYPKKEGFMDDPLAPRVAWTPQDALKYAYDLRDRLDALQDKLNPPLADPSKPRPWIMLPPLPGSQLWNNEGWNWKEGEGWVTQPPAQNNPADKSQ
ncbi:MAG TPA: RHS repeat-associated core domain-containing protein [Pirellulaceae bacterium]|jgi:RHS repeat-associated protein